MRCAFHPNPPTAMSVDSHSDANESNEHWRRASTPAHDSLQSIPTIEHNGQNDPAVEQRRTVRRGIGKKRILAPLRFFDKESNREEAYGEPNTKEIHRARRQPQNRKGKQNCFSRRMGMCSTSQGLRLSGLDRYPPSNGEKALRVTTRRERNFPMATDRKRKLVLRATFFALL